jgi:hypothetical protein
LIGDPPSTGKFGGYRDATSVHPGKRERPPRAQSVIAGYCQDEVGAHRLGRDQSVRERRVLLQRAFAEDVIRHLCLADDALGSIRASGHEIRSATANGARAAVAGQLGPEHDEASKIK